MDAEIVDKVPDQNVKEENGESEKISNERCIKLT